MIGKGGGKAAQGVKRSALAAAIGARSVAGAALAAATGEDRRAIIHIAKHCLTRGLRPTGIVHSNIIDISFV
jgi:hypothetical protein